MVDVLKVSRSGYYTWRQNGMTLSPRAIKRVARDAQILAFFDDSKKRYGAKRIPKDLAANNAKADIKTIMASMSRQGLVPRQRRSLK